MVASRERLLHEDQGTTDSIPPDPQARSKELAPGKRQLVAMMARPVAMAQRGHVAMYAVAKYSVAAGSCACPPASSCSSRKHPLAWACEPCAIRRVPSR